MTGLQRYRQTLVAALADRLYQRDLTQERYIQFLS